MPHKTSASSLDTYDTMAKHPCQSIQDITEIRKHKKKRNAEASGFVEFISNFLYKFVLLLKFKTYT